MRQWHSATTDKNQNNKFEYGFECGCKSIQQFTKTGSYVQDGQERPIVEENWTFHSCGDVRHVSVDSVLDDKNWKSRQDLIKRLNSNFNSKFNKNNKSKK